MNDNGIVQFQVRLTRPGQPYSQAVTEALRCAGYRALRWAVVETDGDTWVIEGAGWRLPQSI